MGLMGDGKGIREAVKMTGDEMIAAGFNLRYYYDDQGHIKAWQWTAPGDYSGNMEFLGNKWTTNWYPPIAQNAVLVPTEEVPVEKIRCPDCGVEDIALSKDAYKEHTYTTLDCGCRFSEPRLLRALKRHVL